MRTQPIPTLALTGLLATLALPDTANATAKQLAANGLRVGGSVNGTFTAAGTQTWRLYLKDGKDYAVSGTGDCVSSVAVRAAGGRTLATFGFSNEDDPDGSEGVTLRAPYTGLYTVEVSVAPDRFPACAPQGRYGLSASRDCAGDASTRCGIVTGQTFQNLHLDYQGDADWFRTTLAAGHAYAATFAAQDCNEFAVLDAHGRPVARDDCTVGHASGVLTFTAPVSGTYYLAVRAFVDPPEPYSLSLTRAR